MKTELETFCSTQDVTLQPPAPRYATSEKYSTTIMHDSKAEGEEQKLDKKRELILSMTVGQINENVTNIDVALKGFNEGTHSFATFCPNCKIRTYLANHPDFIGPRFCERDNPLHPPHENCLIKTVWAGGALQEDDEETEE
jgi:hypothetical protein